MIRYILCIFVTNYEFQFLKLITCKFKQRRNGKIYNTDVYFLELERKSSYNNKSYKQRMYAWNYLTNCIIPPLLQYYIILLVLIKRNNVSPAEILFYKHSSILSCPPASHNSPNPTQRGKEGILRLLIIYISPFSLLDFLANKVSLHHLIK